MKPEEKRYRDLIEKRMRLKIRLNDNKITLVSYLEEVGSVNLKTDCMTDRQVRVKLLMQT